MTTGVSSRNPWRTTLAVLALSAGAMGSMCPPQRYHAVSLAPAQGRLSWERTVRDWTREHQVYHWFDDKIRAHATFHAPAFRKSFIDHRHEFFGHFSEVANRELVEMNLGEVEHFHSFFVAAYVGWQRYRALAHAHTIWTLWLENDAGVRVKAVKFKDVRITPAVQAIYPYVDRFDRCYLVRFPLTDENDKPVITAATRSFTLHITSPYADAQLRWDLQPGSSPVPDFGLPRDGGPLPDAGEPPEEGGLGIGKILGG